MTDQAKSLKTLKAIYATGVSLAAVTSKQLYDVGRENGLTYGTLRKTLMSDRYKVSRGKFDLRKLYAQMTDGATSEKVTITEAQDEPADEAPALRPIPAAAMRQSMPSITTAINSDIFIPESDPTFVPWGDYKDIRRIIESRLFCPVFISGLSGNGKTMMVEQACAKLKREYVRVQISPETDEDDLIGGFRLINGEMIFYKGPVIKAMERGCILLIDELDRGSNKIMCLQGVLEGKPVLIKKVGQVVSPAPGFNVIATANTKGRGSDDGRYSAANIIDDAFLERFVASIDQPYPNFKIERNIVIKHMEMLDVEDEDFANKLVNWSSVIRKTYENEGIDELISTRRLCHIVKVYSVFRDRLRAINMCVNRFEAETREAFLDLYTKIDAGTLRADDADANKEADYYGTPSSAGDPF